MQVTTFYSYKGGVGRTLACANFGLFLAKTGRKVVLADMDFEAPGLDSKFADVSVSEVKGGLIDQFLAFQRQERIPEIQALNVPLPKDVLEAGGSLRLIPAGDYTAADYYKKLSAMNWDLLLREEAGLAFCMSLVARIEQELKADVLVIDARTGLSEVGGLCTQILPDTVVLLTSTNKESLEGTKRIYSHIRNSRVVKKRTLHNSKIDLRIVVTRIPRPESLPELDRELMKRLDLPIERIYYLFSDGDLSLWEYLALDRFDEHPSILDDYVELFASLNPEEILPYIEERLESFRSHITRRPMSENERIIQELVTLFPRSEVILEAARYYRMVKDGEANAVSNYVRFLNDNSTNAEVLAEFGHLCSSVPESVLQPKETIVQHLRTFSPASMDADLLDRFRRMVKTGQDLLEIVAVVENDATKMENENYKITYLETLRSLGEWDKILQRVSERDLRSISCKLLMAEALANIGRAKEAIDVLASFELEDFGEAGRYLRVLYRASPDRNFDSLEGRINFDSNIFSYVLRHPGLVFHEIENDDPDFRDWIKLLSEHTGGPDE